MDEDFWNKSCVIYLITNLLNGKKYVGQTRRELRQRISQHKNDSEAYIDRAIKKHGWENFSVSILEECASPDELNDREIYWIGALNTRKPNGYNLTDGGNKCGTRRRAVRCLNTGEIFESIAAAARKYNIATSNIIYTCQNKQTTAKGMRFEYVDAPLSEQEKPRKKRKVRTKKVTCLEYPDMIFESVKAAGEHFGMSSKHIASNCRGELRSARGLHFSFVDEKEREVAKIKLEGKSYRNKPVRCLETNVIYPSIIAAFEETKINRYFISRACRGLRELAGGYHWQFVDKKEFAAVEIKYGKIISNNEKPVCCIETNVVYRSIQAASKETGISKIRIGLVCRNLAKSAGGYHWRFANEKECAAIATNRERKSNGNKPVRCLETDVVYPSVNAAAEETGIKNYCISKSCHLKRPAGGFHWQFVDAD